MSDVITVKNLQVKNTYTTGRVSIVAIKDLIIRFDPLRDVNRWTVVIDGQRIADTDKPMDALWRYIDEHLAVASGNYRGAGAKEPSHD